MTDIHARLGEVTERLARRSHDRRQRYLDKIRTAASRGPRRGHLSCGNLAHGFAACGSDDKADLMGEAKANIAIVSAYNDMLSAHQPLERFPAIIKAAAREAGAVAQFAGGVPAMCDGVTQGQPGMELSLFSRDVVAMATGIALPRHVRRRPLPRHLRQDRARPRHRRTRLRPPARRLRPRRPMPSGLPNDEKARVRQLYAEGKVGRAELLEAEAASYHSPGTCTFYGTANTNQMLMEIMGLHLPGASFVNPNTPLRDALTGHAAKRVTEITALGNAYTPVGEMLDERAFVNGVVGLHATGGSTNHTLHLVAMAQAAGIDLTWADMAELSEVVPLLCRIYPNGMADVNHFQAAGGMAFLIKELLAAGLLHGDVRTVAGEGGLSLYTQEPVLHGDRLAWQPGPTATGDPSVLAPTSKPFSPNGGLKLLEGNLGRAVIKVSAVKPDRRVVEAPARVFHDQNDMLAAFKAGELERDVVAVVRFQGPTANGMPELHKLTPALGILQDKGFKVALLTDGRMSGASGKVPAAIHLTPEATHGGPIAKIRDGDLIRIDAEVGTVEALVDAAEWAARTPATADLAASHQGCGRELFTAFRRAVGTADTGASVIDFAA
jgi:phosphogluconate dehydratase